MSMPWCRPATVCFICLTVLHVSMSMCTVIMRKKKEEKNSYDAVPVCVQDLVPKSDESESGQKVPEKVK